MDVISTKVLAMVIQNVIGFYKNCFDQMYSCYLFKNIILKNSYKIISHPAVGNLKPYVGNPNPFIRKMLLFNALHLK